MLSTLLITLALQAAPSLSGPGVILVLASDTAFVSPTASIGRTGSIRSATLVQIYRLGPEDWEIARRDADLEMDCEDRRVRVIGGRDVDSSGRLRPGGASPLSEWEPLPEDYPPLDLLYAVTCSDVDLSAVSSENLEAELPRLRAKLE